jgi:hypothetical protein
LEAAVPDDLRESGMDGTRQDGTDPPACHSFIYASAALFPPRDVLLDIVRVAEHANSGHGISGMLCYGACRYVQLLQGPRPALDRLAWCLARDLRHRILWTHRRGPGLRTIPAALPMGYASDAQLRELRLALPPCDTAPDDPARLAALLSTIAARIYPATCAAG